MTLRKATDLLVVHVTATPPSRDIGVKEVDAMHRALGWNGCGYHYVIRRDGRIEKGRPEGEVGSHVLNYNSRSIGVSLVGGIDANGKPQDNATPEQIASLEAILRELSARYPNARVCGHRDLSPDLDRDGVIEPHEYIKACPNFDAIPWAERNGLKGALIKGTWNTKAPVAAPDPDEARISYLQRLLARAGYQFGAVDGDLGPKTRAAIGQFQLRFGLAATRDFDIETVARLCTMFQTPAKAA